MEHPTSNINSLKLALDCEEEGLSVEPEVREQLRNKLEAGLESTDSEIASLAAQVKLFRRLSKLLRIDENREIDQDYTNLLNSCYTSEVIRLVFASFICSKVKANWYYITCAEYQLFVDEWLSLGERFQTGSAKRAITGISLENALGFCAWLSSKAQLNAGENVENQGVYYYRLPTVTEARNYPAREHLQLGCWTVERSSTGGQGIRVVKVLLPPEYVKLTDCLSAGEWVKANQETAAVMGKVANQETQALHTIEQLWRQYSKGRFGLFVFDIVTVNAQGQEIQRERSQARYFTEDLGNGVNLDMVTIPGGTFEMGSPKRKGDNSEHPQHQVTVKPFFIGKYPVTQAQWKAIADLPKVNRDLKPNPSKFEGDNRPVECVSWHDAVEFCERLSRHTGRDYRLPSEAEWEYACRAGTTTPFNFGETITSELANYRGNRGETTPVGQFPPNAFGLYDMHGQVWEWCADTWHGNYDGAPTDDTAWTTGGNDNHSLLRGGSWIDVPDYCRSASRIINGRDDRSYFFGFRVVCGFGRT